MAERVCSWMDELLDSPDSFEPNRCGQHFQACERQHAGHQDPERTAGKPECAEVGSHQAAHDGCGDDHWADRRHGSSCQQATGEPAKRIDKNKRCSDRGHRLDRCHIQRE
jgi:hypothetical protein